MGKEPSLGAKTTRGGTDLRRRVVPVEIRWSIVAGGGSIFAGGVVVGGGGQCFLTELHRFIWRVKILGGKSWGRERIFVVSPGVWDDREVMAWVAFCFGGRRFRGERLVGVGGVGWWGDAAEEDISCRELME